MNEVRDGLWHWRAPHPDWKPGADWDEEVGCAAFAAERELVLIDPLDPLGGGFRGELDGLAEGRRVAVVVSVHWHERDAADFRERYGAELWVRAGSAEAFGADADRTFDDGDELPGGITALDVPAADEALLFIPANGTLVAGDTLIARDGRLQRCPPGWYDSADLAAAGPEQLRKALELPVEAVLVSHGEPALHEGREAIERALAP